MSEKERLSPPFKPKKGSYASKDEVEALTQRMDSFSEKMRTIVDGFNEQVTVLSKNMEEMVKTLVAIRQQSPQGQNPQATDSKGQTVDVGRALSLVDKLIGGTQPPSAIEQFLMMQLRENLMMQRTIRIGMMRKLGIDDLLMIEEKATEAGA